MEVLGVLLIVFLIALFITGLWIVSEVAEKRGRNQFGWVVFSLVVTPVFAAFFLVCLGETEERKWKRIRAEEKFKERVRRKEEEKEKLKERVRREEEAAKAEKIKTDREDAQAMIATIISIIIIVTVLVALFT